MSLHPVLGVRCRSDALLHHLAPMGLAAVKETALLVDLDDGAPRYPGKLSLAELIREGARRQDLGPSGRGVAVLSRGDAGMDEAVELVDVLADGWPAVVVRVGDDTCPYPVVDVAPDLPTGWAGPGQPMVVQSLARWAVSGFDAPVRLPPLRRSQVRSMVNGTVHPRWRWVRAWGPVWELPWV